MNKKILFLASFIVMSLFLVSFASAQLYDDFCDPNGDMSTDSSDYLIFQAETGVNVSCRDANCNFNASSANCFTGGECLNINSGGTGLDVDDTRVSGKTVTYEMFFKGFDITSGDYWLFYNSDRGRIRVDVNENIVHYINGIGQAATALEMDQIWKVVQTVAWTGSGSGTSSMIVYNATSGALLVNDSGRAFSGGTSGPFWVLTVGNSEGFYDEVVAYNGSSCPLAAPPSGLNESFEQAVQFLQVGSVNVNSASFSTILSGTFNVTGVSSTDTYFGATIPATRSGGGDDNVLSCRILVDGSSFDSTFSRTVSSMSSASLYTTTGNFSLSSGVHNVSLQCSRSGSGSPITISASVLNGHLLFDEQDNSLGHEFFNVSNSFNTSSFILLNSVLFTTPDLTPDGVHNASIIVDFNAEYNYSVAGTMNSMVSIGGNNCSLYPRTNGANSLGSVGGDCVLLNAGFNNTYNISFFGLGDGLIQANVHVKGFVNDPLEVNNIGLNGTNITSSSVSLLVNMTVENVDHATIDLFVKAGIPHISNNGSTTSNFFLALDNGSVNSTIVPRSASSDEGVTIIEFLFEGVSQSVHSVELWGSCGNANCSIVGGELVGYLANSLTEIITSFVVNVTQLYDGVVVNNFNVTTSVGNVFSTTTGSVTVDSNFALDNLTVRANNFFPQTIFNYNVTNNVQVNLSQALINFNIFEKVTGIKLFSFTVNDSVQSNTTTTGDALLNLLAGDNQTISFVNDLGYVNDTFLINVSALDNITVNVSNAVNLVLNLSVFNVLNGVSINNFTGVITASNFSFSESFSSTSGLVNISLNQNVTYFVQLDPVSGFSTFGNNLTIESFETNVSFLSRNISLFTNNSISFRIFNVSNSNLIIKTVDIELLGSTITVNLNTSNGTVFVSNLNDDTYSVTVSSVGFSDSKLIATISNNAHLDIDVFMIEGENKIFRIIDTFSNNIANATVTVLQTINGSTITVGQAVSGFDGRVIFQLDETKTYSLIVSASGFDVFTGNIQPVLDAYDIVIFETALSPFVSVWDDISRATLFSYIPNSSFANVTLIINSNQGSLQFYGINVTYEGVNFFVNTSGSPGGGVESLNITGVDPIINNSLFVEFFFKRTSNDILVWNETFFLAEVTPTNISLFDGLFVDVQTLPVTSPVRAFVGVFIIVLLVIFIGSASRNMTLGAIAGLGGLAINLRLELAPRGVLIACMVVIMTLILADNIIGGGS